MTQLLLFYCIETLDRKVKYIYSTENIKEFTVSLSSQ